MGLTKALPKENSLMISIQDHFGDLMSDNIIRILKEKLTKRNIAAHPSSVVVVQSQADDAVTDLVNNVVLALH